MTSLFPDDRTLCLLCRVKIYAPVARYATVTYHAEGMSLYPKKVQKEWRGLDKGVGV